jgi:hypothetical protein
MEKVPEVYAFKCHTSEETIKFSHSCDMNQPYRRLQDPLSCTEQYTCYGVGEFATNVT